MRRRAFHIVSVVTVLLAVFSIAPGAVATISLSANALVVASGETVTVDIVSSDTLFWTGFFGNLPQAGVEIVSIIPLVAAGSGANVVESPAGEAGYYYFWASRPNIASGSQFRITFASTGTGSCDFYLYDDDWTTVLDTVTVSNNSVSVLSPNGGEVIIAGSVYPIELEKVSYNLTTFMDLEYSTDNGVTWSLIASDVSSGPYNWQVPIAGSDQCLIKATNYDITTTVDVSDDMFSIVSSPIINLSKNHIDFVDDLSGSGPVDKTFEVFNTGYEVLNWQISESCSWVSVSPASGDSAGEADTVTVSVDSSGLSQGLHQCTLTVSDTTAFNNPQTIEVSLYKASETPIAHWPFDLDGSDIAGGYDGSFENGAAITNTPGEYRTGTGALTLDGIDDDVSTPYAGILGAAGRTTSAWFKCDGDTGYHQSILSYGGSSGEGNAWRIWINGGDGSIINAMNGGNANSATTGLWDGQWHHVAVTFPAVGTHIQDVKIYVDGSEEITWYTNGDTQTVNTSTDNAFEIGMANGGTIAPFNGNIDDVRVYDRELTGAEILTMQDERPIGDSLIGLSASKLSFSAALGDSNPAGKTLEIRNIGGGTLNWQISESCSWVSVDPASGDSTGESDTVTVSVDSSGLSQGLHQCSLTVSDINAFNDPQTVEVLLYKASEIPIAHWPFDTNPNDIVGGNDGALLGAGITNTPLEYRTGTGALTLDGIDDYVSTPYAGISGAAGRTTSAWFKCDGATGDHQAILGYGGASGAGSAWRIWINGGDGSIINAMNGGNANSATTGLWDGQWHHVAVTFPAVGTHIQDVKIYVDGSEEITWYTNGDTQTVNTSTDNAFEIGMANGGTIAPFNGNIDDVRVYDRELTGAEILALASEAVPTYDPMIGLSASNINFLTVPGGANPVDQVLEISNIGGGTLNWQIDHDCPWLTVSPLTGISTGNPNTVTLSVDSSGLLLGSYHQCTLTVSDPLAYNNPQTVDVSLYLASEIPIAHWPFDLDGSDIVSGFDGTFEDDAAITNTPFEYRTGRGALSLDGVDDYVFTSYGGISGGAGRTTSAWFKCDGSTGDHQAILGYGSASGAGNAWHIWLHRDDGHIINAMNNGNANSVTTGLWDGQWHHVAVTFPSGGTVIGDVKIYVDGYEDTGFYVNETQTVNTGVDNTFEIGMDNGGTRFPFEGNIDDVRVYDRELTGAEILAMQDERPIGNPVIGLSVSSLDFIDAFEDLTPTSQVFEVSNLGGGSLNWQVNASCSWVSVSPASGVSTGETDAVTVSVNPGSLAAGIHQCILTVSDTTAFNNPQTIDVSLHVASETPVAHWLFDLDASDIAGGYDGFFEGTSGIINTLNEYRIGTGAVTFDGVDDRVFTTYAGISGSGARTTSAWFMCDGDKRVRQAILGYGGASGVGNGWHIWLQRDDGRIINAMNGGNANSATTGLWDRQWHHVAVTFPAGGTVIGDVKIYVDGYEDTGFYVNETQTVNTGVDNTFEIGMASGGTQFPFEGNIDDVRVYDRELTGAEILAIASEPLPIYAPVIDLSASYLDFSAYSGGPDPASQVFEIGNTGGETLNWQVDASCSWVSVSPASGDCAGEADTVTVSVDPAGLTEGSHSCELMISDPGSLNSPQLVTVILYFGAESYSNCVVRWPFDLDASDIKGGFHGVFEGGAAITNTPGEYRTGTGALTLDRIDDYVSTSYAGILGSGARTTSAWFKCDGSTGDHQAILSYGGSSGEGNAWRIWLNRSDGSIINAMNGGNANSITTGLWDGQWHHVAVTFPAGGTHIQDVKIYLDGYEDATWYTNGDTQTVNTSSADNFEIGMASGGTQFPFDGNIDDVRVYDMELTGAEILAMQDERPICDPTIGLSASYMNFITVPGGANPADQILEISNIGGGTINWQISESCSWVSVDLASGDSVGEADAVTVSVDPAGLTEGSHSCELMISDPGAVNSPRLVSVNLYIAAENDLVVPWEYPTIQSAIEAASNGDTVVVLDGTYSGWGNYNIYFGGKAITVRSANGPENCIIDCSGSGEEACSGFIFHNYESNDSVLDGFTITGANASGIRCGWGINRPQLYGGSDIYNEDPGCSPTIKNCIITGNSNSAYRAGGGGISCMGGSSAVITDCIIKNNSVVGSWWIRGGGGIYCENADVTITNCVIEDNLVSGIEGEVSGGGIFSWNSQLTIKNCEIVNNTCSGQDLWYQGNHGGGGIYCYDSELAILNSTIAGNSTENDGGGIFSRDSYLTVTNSIIWGNEANLGSAIVVDGYYYGPIVPVGTYYEGPSVCTVSYCDVQGGYAGVVVGQDSTLNWETGNIDADPMFEFNSYNLQAGSLCINAGDPGFVAVPDATDIDGKPRVIGGRVDIGAYEFNHIPVADAGADIIVYAGVDGLAMVQLDGLGSSDEDGDELTYYWYEDANEIAVGVEPDVVLAVGDHLIELIVNDGVEDSEVDSCLVTVVEALEVSMKFTPQAVNLFAKGKWVIGHFVLPEGFSVADVDAGVGARLEPFGVDSHHVDVFVNDDGLVEVEVVFDRSQLWGYAANGPTPEVTVSGKFVSGQCFYGRDTIKITLMLEYFEKLSLHWLEMDCGAPDWCDGADADHSSVVDIGDLILNE